MPREPRLLRGVIDKKGGRYNAAITDPGVLRPDITSGSELNPRATLLPNGRIRRLADGAALLAQ